MSYPIKCHHEHIIANFKYMLIWRWYMPLKFLKKLFLGKKYKLFILEKSLLRLKVAEENSASDSYMECICIFITFWVITKNIFYKLFINLKKFIKKLLSLVSTLFKCCQDFKMFLRKGLICHFLKSKFEQYFLR